MRIEPTTRLRLYLLFIHKCWKSLKSSYKLPLPAFPHRFTNIDAFNERNFKVFIHPIKYMCIQANWKMSNKLYRYKKEMQSGVD